MLGISHLLISGTAASLLLQTADPVLIAVGAIAGLLPDIDVSTSPAGKVFPWISGYFQETMPHTSMTHSFYSCQCSRCDRFLCVAARKHKRSGLQTRQFVAHINCK